MTQDPIQRDYWRKNQVLTGSLLAAWFLITFGGGYFARELNAVNFLGFPLGFYLFAQGALIAFLIIIGIYVWAMQRLDARYADQRAGSTPVTRHHPEDEGH